MCIQFDILFPARYAHIAIIASFVQANKAIAALTMAISLFCDLMNEQFDDLMQEGIIIS